METTQQQKSALIEVYVPRTRILPVTEEPWRCVLNDCTDCSIFIQNHYRLEDVSFHFSF